MDLLEPSYSRGPFAQATEAGAAIGQVEDPAPVVLEDGRHGGAEVFGEDRGNSPVGPGQGLPFLQRPGNFHQGIRPPTAAADEGEAENEVIRVSRRGLHFPQTPDSTVRAGGVRKIGLHIGGGLPAPKDSRRREMDQPAADLPAGTGEVPHPLAVGGQAGLRRGLRRPRRTDPARRRNARACRRILAAAA